MKAVMDSLLEPAADVGPVAVLSRFRRDFHECLTARADELSELSDGGVPTFGLPEFDVRHEYVQVAAPEADQPGG